MDENEYYDLELVFEDSIPEKNLEMLGELPQPEMVLYGINEEYFRSIEELKMYCKNIMLSIDYIKFCSYKVSYFRKYAGCIDVFLKTFNYNYQNPKKNTPSTLLTVIDNEQYAIYNYNKSYEKNCSIWENREGTLRSMHCAFRNKGVDFENDIYIKLEENKEKIYKIGRYGKKK